MCLNNASLRWKAVAALATGSGQAAQFLALNNILQAGTISSPPVFFTVEPTISSKVAFKRLGIEVRFADGDDPESFVKYIDKTPKPFISEQIGNPRLNISRLQNLLTSPANTTSR